MAVGLLTELLGTLQAPSLGGVEATVCEIQLNRSTSTLMFSCPKVLLLPFFSLSLFLGAGIPKLSRADLVRMHLQAYLVGDHP